MTEGTWWWRGGVILALVAACAPHSIEFEHTDGGAGSPPEGSVGGTSGTSAGTSSTGGTSTGATGGSGGGSSTPLPDPALDIGCDYKAIIGSDCAKVGCHKGALSAAHLNLSKTDFLVTTLKDVPATFLEIQCSGPGEPYSECVPAACPSGALLVDSANWEQSFMLMKLRGTQNGCGESMPYQGSLDPAKEACLETLIYTVAGLPPF